MTEQTRVVHVKDRIPGAIYIGRAMPRQGLKASPFANPFKIGAKLPTFEGMHDRVADRTDVLIQYDISLKRNPQMLARIPELRGKALACWCRHDGEAMAPGNACHGDLLIWWLDNFTDDELRAMAQEPAR